MASTRVLKGIILKWNFWRPPQDKKCFDDQAFWEVANNIQPNLYIRVGNFKTIHFRFCFQFPYLAVRK